MSFDRVHKGDEGKALKSLDSINTAHLYKEGDQVDQSVFEDECWLKALSLSERAALLREARPETTAPPADTELARRRAERWCERPPFANRALLLQRLKIDGLMEEEFLRLLGEPPEALRGRLGALPDWVARFSEAYSSAVPPAPNVDALASEENASTGPPLGFFSLVAPLIRHALGRLGEGLRALQQQHAALPFDPEAATEMLFWGFDLPGQLSDKMMRTMILELNVARRLGSLRGRTPEERYRSFLLSLRRPEAALGILREYPVLARQMVISSDNWVNFSLEFLQNLCADWNDIRESVAGGAEPGRLTSASSNAGDLHRQGRSVVIANFDSGLKLVYKPHSLGVDTHFGELLRWLNERGEHPPFRPLKCLDRGTHGWVEFITAEGCRTADEVRRFYERQGGYLALLYALDAVDFHYENLVAAGEHPVLIDLEAIFHPREPQSQKSSTPAEKLVLKSVMGTGLLPQRLWLKPDEGIDVSGIGGAPGQPSPDRILDIERPNTDEMRIKMEHVKIQGSHNRPTLDGAEVNVPDYTDAIIRGFTSTYRLLLSRREELLADDGPLARFASDEVRSILRPTRTYALALQDSYHPDVLRDALDRSCLFDRLWVEAESRPCLARVLKSECEELHRGDIPLFLCRPGSRHLETSAHEIIPDFFDEPSMNTVRRRIRELNDDDLSRQLWFIRASLTSLVNDDAGRTKYPPVRRPPTAAFGREQILARARAVGDRIGVLSLRGEDELSWLGVTFVDERFWTLAPIGTDLYDGASGIALFLAYLGAATREERYTVLAREATATLLRQYREMLLDPGDEMTPVGAFTGCGGVVYALTHLGVLWNSPGLLNEAESIVSTLSEFIEGDTRFDITGGVAGYICVLCGLYRTNASRDAQAAAVRCGDHLLSYLQTNLKGHRDRAATSTRSKLLTGFSHGTAGMAYALLELSALTDDPRYLHGALDAIRYERRLFSPTRGNWPDLREHGTQGLEAGASSYMVAWCHGAPGIGLARLKSLPHFEDAESRAEIRAALLTTHKEGFGYNHSLCHGDLGNIELLLEAAGTLKNDAQCQTRLLRTAADIIDSIDQNGWCCGTPLNVETPGLMTGLAGIGYNLLRIAAPRLVPSVLTLSAPHTRPA